MTINKKQTSKAMASLASETLRDPGASEVKKTLAASVLAQTGGSKQTGAEMEDLAAKVLASDRYSQDTKRLAASVVSQSNKKR